MPISTDEDIFLPPIPAGTVELFELMRELERQSLGVSGVTGDVLAAPRRLHPATETLRADDLNAAFGDFEIKVGGTD